MKALVVEEAVVVAVKLIDCCVAVVAVVGRVVSIDAVHFYNCFRHFAWVSCGPCSSLLRCSSHCLEVLTRSACVVELRPWMFLSSSLVPCPVVPFHAESPKVVCEIIKFFLFWCQTTEPFDFDWNEEIKIIFCFEHANILIWSQKMHSWLFRRR